jgi:hypothetical protein
MALPGEIGPRRMTLPNENLAKESYLTVPSGNWVFALSNEYAGRRQGPIFALALGARLPTGRTDAVDTRGVRLPDNLQLGTGTTDPLAGLLYHQRYYRLGWGLSGLYRMWSKENINHYQWGNEIIAAAYLSYRLNRNLEWVNQCNGNWMDHDTYNGARVPNRAGTVLFYTPSLIYVGAKNVTPQASAEIPVYRDFHESQSMSDYIINIRTALLIR